MPLTVAALDPAIGRAFHRLDALVRELGLDPRPVLATWAVHATNNLAVVAFVYWAARLIPRSPP